MSSLPHVALQGVYPALVTPFTQEGTLYERGLRELVRFHVTKGSDGLFLCGSLGSGPAMTAEERRRVVEVAAEESAGRLKLIVHVGHLNAQEMASLARHAAAHGAAAVAAVPPYYYTVSWPVVREYTRRLLDASSLPVLVYNNPGHAHFEWTPEYLAEAVQLGVRGLKDSSGRLAFLHQVLHRFGQGELAVFCAAPPLLFAALAAGAHGFIGGPNNALPQFYLSLYRAATAGDWVRAARLERRSADVFQLTGGPYAVPMWQALLKEFGVDAGYPRLPFPPITDELRRSARERAQRLQDLMRELDVPW